MKQLLFAVLALLLFVQAFAETSEISEPQHESIKGYAGPTLASNVGYGNRG